MLSLERLTSGDVIAIAGVIALIITILVMRSNNRIVRETADIMRVNNTIVRDTTKIQLFSEIWGKYSTDEMKNTIRALRALYADSGKDSTVMVKTFVDRGRSGAYDIDWNHWDSSRRKATTFYQLMGTLYDLEWLTGDLIYREWSKGDLSIIPNIIVPLDNEALPMLQGKKPTEPKDYHISVKNMIKLWEDAPDK